MAGVGRYGLRASTMVETLVMMLVAGIVFLAVMDGMTLFMRLQTQRAAAILENRRFAEGYSRLESLVAGADTLRMSDGRLSLFRDGRQTTLEVRDSALICMYGDLRDTLLRPVASLSLRQSDAHCTDTVAVTVRMPRSMFTIRFAVQPSSRESYRTTLQLLEEGYGYETDK